MPARLTLAIMVPTHNKIFSFLFLVGKYYLHNGMLTGDRVDGHFKYLTGTPT